MSRLFIVETETDRYIGTVHPAAGTLIVRNGLVGAPNVIDFDEVISLTLAEDHPDVEETAGSLPAVDPAEWTRRVGRDS